MDGIFIQFDTIYTSFSWQTKTGNICEFVFCSVLKSKRESQPEFGWAEVFYDAMPTACRHRKALDFPTLFEFDSLKF